MTPGEEAVRDDVLAAVGDADNVGAVGAALAGWAHRVKPSSASGRRAAEAAGRDALSRFMAPEDAAAVAKITIAAALMNGRPGIANIANVNEADWPEPIPLQPVAPNLPLDALPPVLRNHVASVASAIQVPADIPYLLCLAVVSAAAAGNFVIEVDGSWIREHLMLFGVVIGEAGERKSPAFRCIVAPLELFDARMREQVGPKARAKVEELDVYEKRLQATKQAAARGDEPIEAVERARIDLDNARAAVPVVPQLLAGDSTPEALVLHMAEQGGRVAVLSPEGGPLRILDGRYADGMARLEEFTQAYDGEPLRVRRVGRESVHVPSPALTLGVCLQPTVLQTIRNSRSMVGQGLFGRICWAVPSELAGTRVDSSLAPDLDLAAEAEYERALLRLLELDTRLTEAGAPNPYRLKMSAEAKGLKKDFHDEIEAQLRPGAPLRGMRDWGTKHVGRAVRIAGLLELVTRAGEGAPITGGEVTGQSMASAIGICRVLVEHARVVYTGGGLDRQHSLAAYVEEKIGERCTLKELYDRTKGKVEIGEVPDLRAALQVLEDHNRVRVTKEERDGPGARHEFVTQNPRQSSAQTFAIFAERPQSGPTAPENIDSANIANVNAWGEASDG